MIFKRSHIMINALAMLGLFFFSGCLERKELVHLKGRTMGTNYNIKYYPSNELDDADDAGKKIDELLKEVNRQMSTYIKSSEISYFNETDRLGWLKIGEDFFNVTSYALGLAKDTDGAFDPTIGLLVNLWGFGPGGARKVPKGRDIEDARKRVGFDKILLNNETSEIKKKVPGVFLDLSSLAKGFGVDKVSKYLEENKVKDFMVEIGGEVKTKGTKEKKEPWRIAIEAPSPKEQGKSYQKVLRISGLSLATSGNYRNFFREGGKRYSHTIDTRSGRPVAHTLASVSVADESCMKADALATALMAMGTERGLSYAINKGIPAYFVYREDGQNKQKFVSIGTESFTRLFPE